MERSLRMSLPSGGTIVDQQVLIILVVVAVAVLLGAYAYATQQRRRRQLRDRFGPEYERAVSTSGNVAQAEALLKQRVARVGRFQLHSLTADQVEAFAREWRR